MTTLARLGKRSALACVLVKAEIMMSRALDTHRYTAPTFNHRLARYVRLRKLYESMRANSVEAYRKGLAG